MKKRFTKLIAALALLVFMMPCMAGWGQTTYKLEQVTSVSAGEKYVFEQGGYVMKNSVSSNYLQTTNSYNTTGLSGLEIYVWTLETATSGFYLKNLSLSSNAYLRGNGNDTKLYFDDLDADKGVWSFTYNSSSGNFFIVCESNSRFLGYSDATNHQYRAYKNNSTNLINYTNAIKVYKLVEETPSTTYTFTFSQPENGSIVVTDNNNSVSSGDEFAEGTILNIVATPTSPGYVFNEWTATSGTIADATMASTTFTMGDADAILAASFVEHTTLYDVSITQSIPNGSFSASHSQCVVGTSVTITASPAEGYHVASLTITDGNNNPVGYTEAGSNTYSITMPKSNITISGSFSNTITDVLNYAATGLTGSSYNSWTITQTNSGAVYAGRTGGTYSSIQMNSSSGNGIITTTSGGKVKSISVDWNANSTSGRYITIYGSKNAFENIAGMTSGTSLGTIECGTSTSIDVSGDYYYIGMVANNAIYLDEIRITWDPVQPYAINISATNGTITANPTTAFEGATVSLNATPNANYRFDGYTVTNATTEEAITVSNTGTFTMPASAVNVTGTFTRLYTVTIASGIEHGTVTAEPLIAAEGEEITLTAEPAQHYEFGSWQVSYGQDGTLEPVSNKFNMPAENVTVSATFTQKVYTITYSVNGNTHQIPAVQVPGGNTIGAFPANPVCGDYSFLGWSSIESGTGYPSYVSTSYVPTADMTLYAVFGTTSETSLTITGSTSGIPATYATNSWSINNEQYFGCYNIIQGQYSTNRWIQFRSSGGYLYNVKDFGKITSIVVTYYTGTNSNSSREIAIRINDEECDAADAGEVMSVSNSGDTYTFTYDNANKNYHYFRIYNSSTLSTLSSIQINYEALSPVAMTITRIGDVQTRSESIPSTEFVVVQSGGELTFSGTNTNAANLLIEDGAQLIPSTAVSATMQKDVEAYSDATGLGNTDGWYFVALPLNSNEVTPSMLTTGDYDLYHLNPGTTKWENYKTHSGNDNPGFKLANGEAYLYANSAGFTINFAGEVKASAEDESISVDAGMNLVGNPFSYNVYLNRSYYKMNEARKGIEAVNNNAPIAPCTGVVVEMDAAGEVTFTKTAQSMLSNGNVQIALAQTVTTRGESSSQTLDNAIVSFNEGSQLGKFYFGTQDANLYIPMDNEEYAIVSSSAQGEMPVNFRAYVTGEYTITVNPEEVEMGYLHLIDNIAGVDVDLLANPSYTFNARYDDYESRFRLVFSANMVNADLNDDFAFFSNGQLVIANEGESLLQVIDVNGRIVMTESVNGTCSKAINVKAGVYVLRLIQGTDVKTQKIIVK